MSFGNYWHGLRQLGVSLLGKIGALARRGFKSAISKQGTINKGARDTSAAVGNATGRGAEWCVRWFLRVIAAFIGMVIGVLLTFGLGAYWIYVLVKRTASGASTSDLTPESIFGVLTTNAELAIVFAIALVILKPLKQLGRKGLGKAIGIMVLLFGPTLLMIRYAPGGLQPWLFYTAFVLAFLKLMGWLPIVKTKQMIAAAVFLVILGVLVAPFARAWVKETEMRKVRMAAHQTRMAELYETSSDKCGIQLRPGAPGVITQTIGRSTLVSFKMLAKRIETERRSLVPCGYYKSLGPSGYLTASRMWLSNLSHPLDVGWNGRRFAENHGDTVSSLAEVSEVQIRFNPDLVDDTVDIVSGLATACYGPECQTLMEKALHR